MKYLELLTKHFGTLSEDVLKIESFLRAGDKEMAILLSQHIPNYNEKMLGVFKEYYPTYGDYIKGEYTELGDNEILQYFFIYHLEEILYGISFIGEECGEWTGFWEYLIAKKKFE